MGEMSEWIKQIQPRTQLLIYTARPERFNV